jgi:hypothetical protein
MLCSAIGWDCPDYSQSKGERKINLSPLIHQQVLFTRSRHEKSPLEAGFQECGRGHLRGPRYGKCSLAEVTCSFSRRGGFDAPA